MATGEEQPQPIVPEFLPESRGYGRVQPFRGAKGATDFLAFRLPIPSTAEDIQGTVAGHLENPGSRLVRDAVK